MFKVGDTVRLLTGGPLMTVESVRGDDVVCVWFDNSKRWSDVFKAAALRKGTIAKGGRRWQFKY